MIIIQILSLFIFAIFCFVMASKLPSVPISEQCFLVYPKNFKGSKFMYLKMYAGVLQLANDDKFKNIVYEKKLDEIELDYNGKTLTIYDDEGTYELNINTFSRSMVKGLVKFKNKNIPCS